MVPSIRPALYILHMHVHAMQAGKHAVVVVVLMQKIQMLNLNRKASVDRTAPPRNAHLATYSCRRVESYFIALMRRHCPDGRNTFLVKHFMFACGMFLKATNPTCMLRTQTHTRSQCWCVCVCSPVCVFYAFAGCKVCLDTTTTALATLAWMPATYSHTHTGGKYIECTSALH